jgi:type III secretory pathway component EscS
LHLSLPILVVIICAGLLVSIFQTLTQIQEQTLVYGIKLIAATITLTYSVGWMSLELLIFTNQLFENFAQLTRN